MEYLFVAVIAVIGMITAIQVARSSAACELIDLSVAVGNLKQDYAFTGTSQTVGSKNSAFVLGGGYDDGVEICDGNCIGGATPAVDEHKEN